MNDLYDESHTPIGCVFHYNRLVDLCILLSRGLWVDIITFLQESTTIIPRPKGVTDKSIVILGDFLSTERHIDIPVSVDNEYWLYCQNYSYSDSFNFLFAMNYLTSKKFIIELKQDSVKDDISMIPSLYGMEGADWEEIMWSTWEYVALVADSVCNENMIGVIIGHC